MIHYYKTCPLSTMHFYLNWNEWIRPYQNHCAFTEYTKPWLLMNHFHHRSTTISPHYATYKVFWWHGYLKPLGHDYWWTISTIISLHYGASSGFLVVWIFPIGIIYWFRYFKNFLCEVFKPCGFECTIGPCEKLLCNYLKLLAYWNYWFSGLTWWNCWPFKL